MARLNYGNYAAAYGGRTDFRGLGQAIGNIPDMIKRNKTSAWNLHSEAEWDKLTQPLWEATTKDVENMFTGQFDIMNPGAAYKQFKDSDFKHKNWALGEGLYNVHQFSKQYQGYIDSYVPMLEAKLLQYKEDKDLSDKELSDKIWKNTKLRDFLVKYAKNPKILSSLKKFKTAGEKWQDVGEFLGDNYITRTLGLSREDDGSYAGTPRDVGSALGTAVTAPLLWKGAKWAMPGTASKIASGVSSLSPTGLINQAKNLVPTKANLGALRGATGLGTAANASLALGAGAATMYGVSKLGGKLGNTLGQLTGANDKNSRIAGEAGEITGNVLSRYVAQKGIGKLLALVARKGGVGLVARTIGKVGAGLIGGAFTGGAMTALMIGWTIKDIKDIYDIVNEDLNN